MDSNHGLQSDPAGNGRSGTVFGRKVGAGGGRLRVCAFTSLLSEIAIGASAQSAAAGGVSDFVSVIIEEGRWSESRPRVSFGDIVEGLNQHRFKIEAGVSAYRRIGVRHSRGVRGFSEGRLAARQPIHSLKEETEGQGAMVRVGVQNAFDLEIENPE
jgi:hypothetical protein